jgi:hypothetical protein
MTYLSYAQLRAYAASAGAADPDTAAAVAMAETGGTGDTKAHNPVPPDDSYGPWQINMLGSLGPDRRKKLGITSNTQLYDPMVNARAMVMISNGGTNFTPWTTYTSGKYKKYLKGSTGSTGGTTAPTDTTGTAQQALDVGDVGSAIAAPFKDMASIAVDVSNWVVNPSNWLRVLYVIAGASVVLVGLDVLVQGQVLGKAAKALGGDGSSTASSAGTIGKAALGMKGKAAGAATKAAAGAKSTTKAVAKKAAAPAQGAST